jgi:hypothetical protein
MNKLNELFDALQREFPYSTMGDDFKGNHNIVKTREGKVILYIWSNGKCWSARISDTDLDSPAGLIAHMKDYIASCSR